MDVFPSGSFCAGAFPIALMAVVKKRSGVVIKMKKWFLYQKRADFEQIGQRYRIHPIVARIMRNRDVEGEEQIRKYLYGTLADCYDAALLQDLTKSVQLLQQKCKDGKRIRVIGDYDVDGVCATHILVCSLKALGADVDAAIPHRIKDGYGLNESLILEAEKAGIDTILTCDNGIAAAEQIALAKKLGMTVIVTDHHEVPYERYGEAKHYKLPPADAVVDPKREEDSYPYPGICGAVVAWKLAGMLVPDQINLINGEFVQVAALATVCDVMELQDENRILVREGLRQLEECPMTGLKALLEVNGLHGKELSAYHLGFVLGPCLNATGRLDHAGRALELLQESRWEKAVQIAQELKELNESRKELTSDGVEDAVLQAEEQVHNGALDRVLVIYLPELHESLAGIVAGRIREKYTRPVFVLTDGEEEVKGSGRSIEGYDMYGEMIRVGDLFLKYGGHKMAAGLSIPREKIAEFRQRLNANCPLREEELVDKVHIDVAMPFRAADEKLVEQLKLLEPFGVGNGKPVFAQKEVNVWNTRIYGRNRNVLKCKLQDAEGTIREGVFFGEVESFAAFLEERDGRSVSILYHPVINGFYREKSVELVIDDYC